MKTICIAGKNKIAVYALRYLKINFPTHNFYVVLSKNDDGVNSWQPSLRYTANQLSIPIVTLEEMYSIEKLIFISLEFDRIIRPEKFRQAFLFNIHFSDLPKYKGMFTSVLPILHHETQSGVTLHKMDSGIDTGDIIDQITFPLNYELTSRELYMIFMEKSFKLFKSNIESIVKGQYKSVPQDIINSTYYSKNEINFSNLNIDFNKTAFEIKSYIRAFTFREYQLISFKDFKINRVEITNAKSLEKPGKVLFENEQYFTLATIDYDILLYKDYYSECWTACKEGNLNSLRNVYDKIPDLLLKNNSGWNAIILAVYNGHLNIVKYLLENSADINASINSTNYKGTTVTMYALSYYKNSNDDTMLKLILSHNPDLYAQDEAGRNILSYISKSDPVYSLIVNA